MANVKNFGLIGVGSDLQLGKGGVRLVGSNGAFSLKGSDGTAAAGLSASTVTASTGDFVATAGKLVLNDTNLSRHATGVLKFDGTGALMAPVGTVAERPTGAAGMVRVFQDGGDASVEYFDGTAWQTLANTGTDIAGLQTEIDAIETALGAGIDGNGDFVAASFSDSAAGASSFTDAINKVAAAVAGGNSLDEIFPGAVQGNVIYFDGTNWQQDLPGSTSNVQAWDAALDSISGLTTSADQMIYTTAADTYATTSLTSFARTLLADADAAAMQATLSLVPGTDVQAQDAGLQALADKTTTGILVQTGDDTFVSRALVAPTAGITISDADGVAGAPTFALSDDLAALEGLAGTGFAVRTGTSTWTERVITGTAERIVVTDGDGVAASPTIDLAEVTQGTTGTFVKVTLDGYGRVSGNTAVTTADITGLADTEYLRLDGTTTMTADLNAGGFKVVGLAEPTASSDAATKNYVDNAVTGLTWKVAANLLADTDVALTGSDLNIDSHGALTEADSGYRILLVGQTDDTENGIYVATVDVAGAYTLARASDANTYQELIGASIFVLEGTVYANTGWVQSNHYITSFAAQSWVQFSGAGAYTAGSGVDISGNVISAVAGAGITIGADIAVDVATGALSVAGLAGQLELLLDGAGLEQSATGLKISDAGVTNAMLANSFITLDAGGAGTDNLALGGTLHIQGDATQGITTEVVNEDPETANGYFKVSASDASTTQKGVASFADADFSVTAGAVSIKAGGVSNTQLVNSSITFAGDTGSDAVALGSTFTVAGSGAISTAEAAGTVTVSVATATSSVLGVASFDAADFDVTAGAVSIKAGSIDLTTDVTGTLPVANGGTGAASFTAGQLLIGDGTNAIAQSANLAFDATTTVLTVGAATFDAATDLTITATGTNADINLVPNGTGVVNIGAAGAGVIASDAGEALTVRGNATLVLESTSGDVVLTLASGTTDKVTVSGPTAAEYATGLAAEDLVNKQYVDDAIASGAAAGAIKAFAATVDLAGGAVTVGTMPAGATVLRVKMIVTSAADAGTLVVGKSGTTDAYMTADESEVDVAGMYMAETYVTETGSVAILATPAGAASGTVKVMVEYQVAQ